MGREVRGTSSVLRVRTAPECSEDNLKQLMCFNDPNYEITKETKKKKKNLSHERL